jgi:hypothetical protein
MAKENSKKSFTLDFPSFSKSSKNLSQLNPKKIESTSTIDSDGLKKQIRSYMSSSSIFAFKKPTVKANWLSATQLEPIRRISTLSDNALSVKNIKPFIPKSHRYSSSNLKSSQKESGSVIGQSYSSVCLPVMCMSYYPVGTVSEKLTGELKFFDETQNYGFFMLDTTGEDLFVHYDDFAKSGISKECIRTAKEMNMKFTFRCISYYGKYNLSYKAVDIHLMIGLEGINQEVVH